MRKIGLVGLILGLLILSQMSWACGCGGLIIDENTYTEVPQERAFIRWDGSTQDIIMELSLSGNSPDAALLVPLPAQPRVQLADAALFEELSDYTKPRPSKSYIYSTLFFAFDLTGDTTDTAISSQPESVIILEQQSLGDLEVTTLAASDGQALTEWLGNNGYQLPADYPPLLAPYIEQEWVYVAIKLNPQATQTLEGRLDPIWFSFPAEKPVYPMRLTAASPSDVLVILYLFADHRLETDYLIGADDTVIHFADWLDPSDLAADSALKPLIPQRGFLTKHTSYFWRPENIQDDYYFQFAAEDHIYHASYRQEVLVGVLGLGVLDWMAFAFLGVLAYFVIITAKKRNKYAEKNLQQ